MRNEVSIIRLPASGSQNYEAQLFTLFEELERAGEIKAGAVADAWVLHDRWCAVYHGQPCNCNPYVEISARENGPGVSA
jgi:hypothetical protein